MFDKLRNTFSNFTKTIVEKTITEDDIAEILDELEISLLQADVALEVVENINKDLKKQLGGISINKKETTDFIKGALRESIYAQFKNTEEIDIIHQIKKKNNVGLPYLIMFLGINGTGKTTTLAKLAYMLKQHNITVAVAAADTFRAGAIEQIREHTDKLQIKLIAQNYNSDPAAVAKDAALYAKSHRINCVLIDTAGRIQTSSNLMQQIEKITKVVDPDLKIFVGDSLAGNDVVSQASEFYKHTEFDGSILTKSDADAKGGAALSIVKITSKPVLFLGVGQEYEDLVPFKKEDFLYTLLGDVGKVDTHMQTLIHKKIDTKKMDNQQEIVAQYNKSRVFDDQETVPKSIKIKEVTSPDQRSDDNADVQEHDPFNGLSDEDITKYSEIYGVEPPETDVEAAKVADAVRRWTEQGRPEPDVKDNLTEKIDTTESDMHGSKRDEEPQIKKNLFGLFRK